MLSYLSTTAIALIVAVAAMLHHVPVTALRPKNITSHRRLQDEIHFTLPDGTAYTSLNWMSTRSDALRLQDMLLPGTHDSCAINVNDFAQTQWSDVGQQLRRGIRYLDMRVGTCEGAEDHLCMYHGSIYLDMNFDGPVWQIYEFLRYNPSEVVIMRLKQEHREVEGTTLVDYMLTNYIEGHHEWYHRDSNLVDLTLGQVRGRIVLLWDDASWSDQIGYPFCDVAQRFGWTFDSVEDAFTTFKDRLVEAPTADVMYENPTSMVLGLGLVYPKVSADAMNPMVQDALNQNPKTKGIISMDFPHNDMIAKIIQLCLIDPEDPAVIAQRNPRPNMCGLGR